MSFPRRSFCLGLFPAGLLPAIDLLLAGFFPDRLLIHFSLAVGIFTLIFFSKKQINQTKSNQAKSN